MIRLLLSSAGRRVGLMECFRKAANELDIDLEITAVDMNPQWSPACQVADRFFEVPMCQTPQYLDCLLKICTDNGIHLIIPTIDTELSLYASNRRLFRGIGTEILVSNENFIAVARNKDRASLELNKHGIKTPLTWKLEEIGENIDEINFPVIAKPVDGSCSQGITYFTKIGDLLRHEFIDNGNFIVQEVCAGNEYTINAFYDRNGQCQACVPHLRKTVRDGEVCFAETVRIPEFTLIAKKMSEIFHGLWGNICFQGFMDEGTKEVRVFDLNARFGGGYPICDHAGGKYAKWILQDLVEQEPDYNDGWKEGLRMLRYDDAVFI